MKKYYNGKRILSNYYLTTNNKYYRNRNKLGIGTRIKGRILKIYNKIKWGI